MALELEREARLVGWKDIANHLGCSERSARRWESEEDLPVHRQQHDKRSTVYALPAELNAWLGSRSEQPKPVSEPEREPSRARTWAAAALVVGVVLLGAIAFYSRPPGGTPDRIATDLYERGVALWRQRGEVPNARAIKLLTQAVERDDEFAKAWAALASAWLTYPTYTDAVSDELAIDRALLAADRAARLDPTLAEPRTVMASIAQRQGDWVASERIFREALAADPENTSLMLWFAGHYRELGMMSEAWRLTESARELDPNSPPILTEIAMNTYSRGDVEESVRALDYLWFDLGLETPIVWLGRWFGLIERGDFDAALSWVEKTPYDAFRSVFTEYVQHMRSKGESASDGFVDQVMAAYASGLPGFLAYHMLDQTGSPDAALDVLELESEKGYFDVSVVLYHPRGGSARSTDRFATLVARLGHLDYWRSRTGPDVCKDEPAIPLCRAIAE